MQHILFSINLNVTSFRISFAARYIFFLTGSVANVLLFLKLCLTFKEKNGISVHLREHSFLYNTNFHGNIDKV